VNARAAKYVILSLLLACAHDPEPPAAIPPMSDAALLERISLDVRGVRPTTAELDRLDADPAALDALIDEYLHDPRFRGRVADLWSEIWLTRSETWPVTVDQVGLQGVSEPAFDDAIGSEPLQILGEIADRDLAYTDLVTADWTMSNEITAAIWPIDRPDGDGWQRSTYTDGRPAAGVLATNSFYWRYTSTESNANRKRANQISRILLCHDYLTTPIEFDRNINLLDGDAVSDALRTDPGCLACHASLDPIASYSFGFWWYSDAPADMVRYHPDRELRWRDYTGVPPAWYGDPGDDLRDLGQQIAGDNRFVECAVQQSWELLLRRESTLDDTERLSQIRDAFLDGGLTVRSMVRAVVDSPEYRAGATADTAAVPKKLVTPDLLESQIEDLTGFRWTYYDYDMLKSDVAGFRTLAGGVDGYTVTRSATAPNATIVLVQERLAEAASDWCVTKDTDAIAVGAEPHLFDVVDFSETPDTDRDAMIAQIQSLHRRIFGTTVAADGPEVEANLALWADLYAIDHSPVNAWKGVLTALLRDPDLLLY
jgi:hypothetical protein